MNLFIALIRYILLSYDIQPICDLERAQDKRAIIDITMFLQKSKHDDQVSYHGIYRI